MQITVGIRPEASRKNLLDDGIDRYLGINRRDERFLARKICRYVRHAGSDFGEPIRKSNCALAWSGAFSCYGVLPRKDRHGQRAQPRRQRGAHVDVDGTPFRGVGTPELSGSATTVATASLIENWIDG